MVLVACPFIIRASLGLPRLRWTMWAGALSYPLYATHVPVLRLTLTLDLHPMIGIILMALVAVFVTATSEKPSQDRRRIALTS